MKVYYLIEDMGDGSSMVRFYDSEAKALADLNGDDSDYFVANEYGVQSFEADNIQGLDIR
jgi:hypothetical protein